MSKENKLGIVIGTKDEALWTKVKETAAFRMHSLQKEILKLTTVLEEAREELKVNKEFEKLCEHKILLEKRK